MCGRSGVCAYIYGEASCVSLPRDRWSALPHFAALSGSGECGTSILLPHPLALCMFITACGAVHTGDAAMNEHTEGETQIHTCIHTHTISLSLSASFHS